MWITFWIKLEEKFNKKRKNHHKGHIIKRRKLGKT